MMITGDAMAPPLIEALDDPGCGPRPVVVARRCQHRGAVLALGEGPVPRALPEPHHHRRDRRRRRAASTARDGRHEGQHRDEGRPDGQPCWTRPSCSTRTSSRRAGLGRHRQGRPRGQHPARVLQGPGEDGRDVRHRRRHALRRSRATSRPSRPTARSRCSGAARSSINSGGEKIYPEEVEARRQGRTPTSYDCIVVGVPDERWGQRWRRSCSPAPGIDADARRSVQEHCRHAIAGYKLPASLHLVDTVVRSPSGKPDYRWAAAIVNAGAGNGSATKPEGGSGA